MENGNYSGVIARYEATFSTTLGVNLPLFTHQPVHKGRLPQNPFAYFGIAQYKQPHEFFAMTALPK